jgi:hypothetical protein
MKTAHGSSKHYGKRHNETFLRGVIDKTFHDKAKADEVSEMADYILDETSKIVQSGADVSAKAYKYLQKNWKPVLAVASVAAIGTYFLLRSNKPVEAKRRVMQADAKSRAH